VLIVHCTNGAAKRLAKERSGFASPTSAAGYAKLFHCFPNALAISSPAFTGEFSRRY
jgi:hypothetical protein